jgi:hemerythrin-like domain-containing protein
MSSAVDIIRDEHRSIGAVLSSLTRQVASAAAGTEPPDYPLYGAMLDYLVAFPERLHHPKEEEFLFRRLRQRAPSVNALLDELEAQHVSGSEQLQALRAELARSAPAREIGSFAKLLSRYAEEQWQHMRMEEEQVLPRAQQSLSADDWREIDAAFAMNRETQW